VSGEIAPKKIRGIFEKVPASGEWWIRFADAAGRIRREKAGTRAVAQALLHKRKQEALEGRKLPETLRGRSVTFNELVDDALTYSRSNKRSYHDDELRAVKLRAWFGETPADSIKPRDIEAKLQALADEGLAAATVNRFRSLVSLIFRQGMKNEKVENNPARLTDLRHEDNGRTRHLSPGEEEKLRAVIREEWPEREPELDIALHTGLRRGSMYRLTWADVDFEHGLVRERKPKRGKVRYIPMNPVALAAFLKLRQAFNADGRVFDIKKPRHWFEKAVAKAGIVDFHWHDLRHTFASRLTMLGVPLKQVQELMGHGSIGMTARYSHLAPAFAGDAVARLAGFGKAAKGPLPGGISPGQTDTRTDTAEMLVQ
jgi:integrase